MSAMKYIRTKKMISQRGLCYYCNQRMSDESGVSFSRQHFGMRVPPKALSCTAEHLLARCEGGGNSADNIVAACWYCNTQRHKTKKPRTAEAHLMHVQQQVAAGKWFSAQFTAKYLLP